MSSIDTTADHILRAPEALRRQRWQQAIDGTVQHATDADEVRRALDFNGRLATRVRELAEQRKVRAPWFCA